MRARGKAARYPAYTALLLLACAAACAGPRDLEFNPQPPSFPPPMFTEDLVAVSWIGGSEDAFLVNYPNADRVATGGFSVPLETYADRDNGSTDADPPPDPWRVYLHALTGHAYVMQTKVYVEPGSAVVLVLVYDLLPAVKRELNLRMGLHRRLTEFFGAQLDAESHDGSVVGVWARDTLRLVWVDQNLVVSRRAE